MATYQSPPWIPSDKLTVVAHPKHELTAERMRATLERQGKDVDVQLRDWVPLSGIYIIDPGALEEIPEKLDGLLGAHSDHKED